MASGQEMPGMRLTRPHGSGGRAYWLGTQSQNVYRDLFIPQGNHWVNARRAARGNKTRQSCHRQESKRYQGDSRDIVGSETVEQGGHPPGRDRRQDQANDEASQRPRHAALAEGEQYFV